ncbi:MAG: RnfABCDGE type electron transport complex subunit D, partial [Oscillospiraceae bacterium]|nr:RnfABCDGE type electron transport complex subunit D [Oscillospiraceae bacterium]
INLKGRIIFGIGCGLLTSFIRLFGSLPEGVSFSIILMNILVPHIEHLTTPKPFGTVKEKKKKGAEKA